LHKGFPQKGYRKLYRVNSLEPYLKSSISQKIGYSTVKIKVVNIFIVFNESPGSKILQESWGLCLQQKKTLM